MAEEETPKTEVINPKKEEGLNIEELMKGVKEEIAEEEKKKQEEYAKKLAELDSKSYSKDEVKNVIKEMLKKQEEISKNTNLTKEEMEKQMEDLKKKLDDMSGSQVQTKVEDKPFASPKDSKNPEGKVELTDEWVLKQKGLI